MPWIAYRENVDAASLPSGILIGAIIAIDADTIGAWVRLTVLVQAWWAVGCCNASSVLPSTGLEGSSRTL
jgi:hypothetical protein